MPERFTKRYSWRVPSNETMSTTTGKSLHVAVEDLSKRFGPVEAVRQLSLSLSKGSFAALLGPSGCGKSTTLRLIAGLEVPDAGSIWVDGTMMADDTHWLAPRHRGIGLVFQDYALFPHMSVRKNIGFALPGLSERDRNKRIDELLEMALLSDEANRHPHELSGGQQQRVAVARALAPKPHLVLLDEPFSNLDAGLRAKTRMDVERLLRDAEATAILVTHDQEEALSFADTVAVMIQGSVAQTGTPHEIYEHPVSADVAALTGAVNFVRGRASENEAVGDAGRVELLHTISGEVDVMVRPERLIVREDAQADARVISVSYHGPFVLARVGTKSGKVHTARLPSDVAPRPGSRVALSVNGPAMAYPATSAVPGIR